MTMLYLLIQLSTMMKTMSESEDSKLYPLSEKSKVRLTWHYATTINCDTRHFYSFLKYSVKVITHISRQIPSLLGHVDGASAGSAP